MNARFGRYINQRITFTVDNRFYLFRYLIDRGFNEDDPIVCNGIFVRICKKPTSFFETTARPMFQMRDCVFTQNGVTIVHPAALNRTHNKRRKLLVEFNYLVSQGTVDGLVNRGCFKL